MEQKTMRVFGAVIAGFVILILIIFLIASCSKKSYTFESLEKTMLEVAKQYYETSKDLPKNDKETRTITLTQMINNGDINSISKLFNKDISCEGNVTITNNNGLYLYTPYLNCGKEYETKYLSDKIIEDSLVEQGIGLYNVNNQYIMKGEVENNYVSFEGKLFRIIRINEDKTIRLFELEGTTQVVWDDRFNSDYNTNNGINEFEFNQIDSRIKESITKYYNDENIWTKNLKKYITTQSLCIGKRSESDASKDGSTECSKKIDNQSIGVLSVYEYLQASLDNSCSTTIDSRCSNYNWLSKFDFSTWTLTGDVENSGYAYVIYESPMLNNCSAMSNINAVFNLSDKAIYVSGNGTINNPYTFR